MQHPDEGTIHSWLDGALSAEEAARVASHVAECPQCAAAVAEARGFIAASSRILTALDDVPRGVVPAAALPARRRDFRLLWRAAAAMLVVAGGSLIVLREDSREVRAPGTVEDGVPVVSKASSAMADLQTAEGAGAAEPLRVTIPETDAASLSRRRAAAPPAAGAASGRISTERDLSGRAASERVGGVTGSVREAPAADAAVAQSVPPKPSANIVAAQSDVPPLKVLKTERNIGSRRTVYEISPTDTVILTESEPVFLSGVVATGIASAQDQQERGRAARSVAPMRAEPAGAPSVAPSTDTRRAADTATVSTEATVMAKTAAPAQAATPPTATVNTIRWTDAATGRTLTLSGKLSVEQLQEIRRRIEAERAAANRKP